MTGDEKNMKTIYTFTLDGKDYLSEQFQSKLRLFAFILYEEIDNYGIEESPLDMNENIVRNRIHEERNEVYHFDSDEYDDGRTNYEPFIIGKRSFGLTVVDDSINEHALTSLIQQSLYLLKLNCHVTIKSVSYSSLNKSDESERKNALSIAYGNLGCNLPPRKLGFSRKRVPKRIVSLF